MPVIKHVHDNDCPWGGNAYIHYLVQAAPDILWFNVQDVGEYQGSVYGVGLYKKKILIYEDYYGSCSGCGAWGEGDEPENQEDILSRSSIFSKTTEAIEYLAKMSKYDKPDMSKMIKAIKAADRFRSKKNGG